MKCIVHNCQNHDGIGAGRIICVDPDDDGWICEPCWQFLVNGRGEHSQLLHNVTAHQEATHLSRALTLATDEIDDDEFLRQLAEMDDEWEYDYDDEESDDPASREGYEPWPADADPHACGQGMPIQSSMDIRAEPLEFNHFTVREKVVLKMNGVLILHGDSYYRDGCNCPNLACRNRWRHAQRKIDYVCSDRYQNYVELIQREEEKITNS